MAVHFYVAWTACRLILANKMHPSELPPGVTPDTRPVSIGNAERRLFIQELQDSYNKILKPMQNVFGIKNWISIVTFSVQATLDANPDFRCDQGDMRNRYNEVERVSVVDEIREHDSLSNTLAFSHAMMAPLLY